jgi:hypothetical protein
MEEIKRNSEITRNIVRFLNAKENLTWRFLWKW